MSTQYLNASEVPTIILHDRLKQLASSVAKGDFSDFSMRVPAELDRDADFVISGAATRLVELESRATQLEQELSQAEEKLAEFERQEPVVVISHAEWDEMLKGQDASCSKFDPEMDCSGTMPILLYAQPKPSAPALDLDGFVDALLNGGEQQ